MFYVIDGKFISFMDFINEGLVPRETEFGTDLTNGDTKVLNNIAFTFFKVSLKSEDLFYAVAVHLRTGEIFVGANEEFSKDLDDYTDSRRFTHRTLRIFSKALYVLIELVTEYNVKSIKFASSSRGLGVIYEKLTVNQPFLKSIKKHGFKYRGQEGDYYIYAKE